MSHLSREITRSAPPRRASSTARALRLAAGCQAWRSSAEQSSRSNALVPESSGTESSCRRARAMRSNARSNAQSCARAPTGARIAARALLRGAPPRLAPGRLLARRVESWHLTHGNQRCCPRQQWWATSACAFHPAPFSRAGGLRTSLPLAGLTSMFLVLLDTLW